MPAQAPFLLVRNPGVPEWAWTPSRAERVRFQLVAPQKADRLRRAVAPRSSTSSLGCGHVSSRSHVARRHPQMPAAACQSPVRGSCHSLSRERLRTLPGAGSEERCPERFIGDQGSSPKSDPYRSTQVRILPSPQQEACARMPARLHERIQRDPSRVPTGRPGSGRRALRRRSDRTGRTSPLVCSPGRVRP